MTIDFGKRYVVERELGKGGMGSVLLATDLDQGIKVALKVPSFSDQRRVDRFKDEYKILRFFNSSSIPKAFDLSEDPLFISMEYIDGVTLGSLIQNNSLPPYTDRLIWLKQIARAVQEIHQQKVVFCDLTPNNILVTKNNSLKLIDFGISVFLGDESSAKPQTVVGTNYYMSPEQLKTSKIDFRSDLYSFGVVGYELLTGTKAFDAEESLMGSQAAVTQIRMKHLVGKIPSAKAKHKEISSKVNDLLQICMQKDKNDRYNNIEEVIGRLEQGPSFISNLFKGLGF